MTGAYTKCQLDYMKLHIVAEGTFDSMFMTSYNSIHHISVLSILHVQIVICHYCFFVQIFFSIVLLCAIIVYFDHGF